MKSALVYMISFLTLLAITLTITGLLPRLIEKL